MTTTNPAPILMRIGSKIGNMFTSWKVKAGAAYDFPKYILIGAHHTSNWDALVAMHIIGTLNLKIHYMVKDSLYKNPLSRIVFQYTGGVPIDRHQSHNLVETVVKQFQERDHYILGIAPEGTRKYVEYWRTGFYYMALEAKVPILMAFVDYKSRTIGMSDVAVHPSGDLEKDLDIIRAFYNTITPRYPELKGEIKVRPRDSEGEKGRKPELQ